jgi:endonuclease/exonuclease/phosphatase family metal-dependent hydrolase
MRLRLVTINTAKEDRPYRRRIDLLARGLQALSPDLVLLQETLNTPDPCYDTTLSLADALGLDAIQGPARRKPRRVCGEVIVAPAGLGLLTRLPVVAHETLTLPTDPSDGERIALFARVAIPAGELLVINTHLTFLRNGAGVRRRQIEAIFNHPWLELPWTAAVLGGDLNTNLPELPDLFAWVPEQWSLQDVYAAAGGPEPRVTMPAYWASSYDRCLDYLISIARRGEPHPRWCDPAVVLTEPDEDGVYPSDHRGVMATLELPGEH